MNILQTHLQLCNSKLPTKLEFNRIAYKPSLITSEKDLKNYRRKLIGAEGEEIVLDYLSKYGKKHWTFVRNLWMNHNGNFESDIILFTRNMLYIFEVKNYTGVFTYDEGVCKINDRLLDYNCIAQTQRAYVKIKNILKSFPAIVPVEHALIFVGIDSEVIIHSNISDIEIIPRYRLLRYIKNIVKQENRYSGAPINAERILNHFEKYEIDEQFRPEPVTHQMMEKVKRGISCKKCESFDIQIKKHFIQCFCGFRENREEAIVRTIKEYGILNFKSHIKIKPLIEFFAGQLSRPYLKEILNRNFTIIENHSHTYYLNDCLVPV